MSGVGGRGGTPKADMLTERYINAKGCGDQNIRVDVISERSLLTGSEMFLARCLLVGEGVESPVDESFELQVRVQEHNLDLCSEYWIACYCC